MRVQGSVRHVGCGLVTALVALAPPALGQPPLPPAFATQATAITLDVVVLDESGQPVSGLAREDFVLLEDGREQRIVGFDAVAADKRPAPPPPPGATTPTPAVAPANHGPRRSFVLLLDDLGMQPLSMEGLRPSISSWLVRAAPDDEITLLTTSGQIWWSDLAGDGQADLLAALEKVKGLRDSRGGIDSMSDWEAYRIATTETESARQATILSRGESLKPPTDGGSPESLHQVASLTVLDRVARRWLDARACLKCEYGCIDILELCRSDVEMRARQVYDAERRRRMAVLQSLERLAWGLGSRAGRKSVMVFSESFLRDQTIESALRGVLEAAQQALVSIYFVSTQGLTGVRWASADQRAPLRPGDIGGMSAEDNQLEFAAAAHLADETGGRLLAASNDMGEGLARMATDASAAYLLGYQPEKPPDGDWHRLEVRIRRPGLKVRARRRYLASLPAATATREARGTRPTAPALTAGTTRGDIALRVAAYIRDPDELRGLARIQVAVEVDSRSVQALAEPSGGRSASIDLTIQAVSLGRPLGTPQVDQRLDMTLGSTDEPASWLAVREIALPPGVAQVRALVRDRTSGRIGLAIRRLEIPDLSRPYVGTPILSDRVAPPHKMGEPPSLAPVARRAFSAAGRLYCQFEVFNYGGLSVPGLAKLSAGYTLTGPDGSVVRTAPPTAIDTATNRAVRRVELPVKDLAPGDYLLQVAVEDRLAGQTLIAREAFTLEP